MPFSCPDFGASKIGQKLFKIPGGTIIIRFRSCEGTQGLTRRNRGHFGWGAIITLDTNCTFTNIPGPGVRTANFAAFGSWPGVLQKNAESLRDSDALMRIAVPQASQPLIREIKRIAGDYARRCSAGVAAPPGRVIFSGLY